MKEINLAWKPATQCDLFPSGPKAKGERRFSELPPNFTKTDGERLFNYSSYLFTQEPEALASFP